MAGRKHTVFILITVVLLCFAMLGAFLFITANSLHHCTHDDDCAVCRMIDAYIHCSRFGIAVVSIAAVLIAAVPEAAAVLCRMSGSSERTTLIKMKTELRN